MTSARSWALAGLLAALLLAGSLAALPSYGIAWDEGLGDLFFGHRNLAYLVSGDARFLDFERRAGVDGDGRTHPDLFLSPLRARPWEHWPVMSTLSAALCEGLARRTALMDPVDAHHLAGPLVLALLLPLFCGAAERAWGLVPALAASVALLLHPRMLGAAWFDLKDTGSAVFTTAALLLVHDGLVRGRALSLLGAGVAAGLALGTKANVLFLPLPLAVFWIAARPALPRLEARTRAALGAAPLLAFVVFVGSWPWLRADLVARLTHNLGYVGGRALAGSPWPSPWPVLTALASWPIGTLALVAVGAAGGVQSLRRRSASLEGLALLAAVFPLLRLSSPGVVSFDGIRHALEFLPAAALLAGAGARRLLASGARKQALVALALLLVEPAVEVALVHPHEIASMSPLVGGPAGARGLGFPGVEDYWATGYRRALAWIEAHAEPDAAVAEGVAGHLLVLEGTLRLRPGRALVAASSPFRPDPGADVAAAFRAACATRPVYLVYITRAAWYSPIVRAAERMEPVWTEGPPGLALVKVVRFAPAAPPAPISPSR